MEKPRALAALVLGKTAHRIVADPAVERTIGRAHEVDEPGFAHRGVGGDFAEGVHVAIKA